MIKDILEKLEPKIKDQLMVAFEEGFTQIIEYDKDQYIGVNVPKDSDFKITFSQNNWSLMCK